jgi:hypothetical protein
MLTVLLASMAMASPSLGAKPASPQPEKVVRQMCDYLASLKQFSYSAKVNYDAVDPQGKKQVHTFEMKTAVQRPDKLQVNASGDVVNKEFFLNGNTLTLYDKKAKVYATLDVPPDIEGALEKAHKEYNLQVALTDLASPKLYQHLSKGLADAQNLGIEEVREVPCHHLVIKHHETQLHLWIDTGAKPLMRKVMITTDNLPQAATWTAVFGKWNVEPLFSDKTFTFVVPTDAHKIKFLPAQKAEATRETQPVNEGR